MVLIFIVRSTRGELVEFVNALFFHPGLDVVSELAHGPEGTAEAVIVIEASWLGGDELLGREVVPVSVDILDEW